MPRRPPWFARPAAFVAVFAGGLFLGWSGLLPNPLSGQPAGVQHEFIPFWQVWRLVEDKYVDRKAVKPEEMKDGAIRGMLASLGDTDHTRYLTREGAERLSEDLSGHMVGIGVEFTQRQGRLVIVGVLSDSPAQKAGARPGDVVEEVDGKDIKDKPFPEIRELLLGKEGTEVRLTVGREGEARPVTLTITRARIEVPDVSWRRLQGRPVAHLRIRSFGEKVDEQLKKALADARQDEVKRLVVDLRGNSGGIKEQAVAVTSEFLKEGAVFIEQDAHGRQTPVPVLPGGGATDMPLVVLIDEGTASSAEIFAGAIQDHKRGKLVGTRTAGTGTVLQPYRLSDGSELLLAVAEWLTPDRQQIWHKGITPDVPVALPPGANILWPNESGRLTPAELAKSDDKQLLKALEVLDEQFK
jgi:carboxyl-terminal processing protease